MFTQPISSTTPTARPQNQHRLRARSSVSPRCSGIDAERAAALPRDCDRDRPSPAARRRAIVGVGLRPRDTRLQPRDDAVVLRRRLRRSGTAAPASTDRPVAAGEAVGHHADDRVRLAAQRDRPADRARVAVEQPRSRGDGSAPRQPDRSARSSSAVNSRPSAGATPSTRKKPADTRCCGTYSACVPTTMFTPIDPKPPLVVARSSDVTPSRSTSQVPPVWPT